MNVKFKILLLAALMGVLACNKEPDDIAGSNESLPIQFGQVETRAIVEDVEAIKTGGFGVFAYMNGGAGAESVYSPVLENKNVYWNSTDGVWTYENEEYWTLDRNYHFFAYWPYDDNEAAINGVAIVKDVNGNSIGNTLAFTTPQTADVDLMTASATVDTSDPSFSKIVPMAFQHELVQVNVEVTQNFGKNPNQEFCVNAITLSNIRSKGTLTTSSLGENTARSWAYDGPVAPISFSYTDNTDTPIRNIDGEVVKLSTNNLLLIPQAAGTINLAISYKYGTYTDDVLTWQNRSANVNLPAGTWQAGTNVTYSVNLYEDNYLVFVKVAVDSWGSNQSGGTIIIK